VSHAKNADKILVLGSAPNAVHATEMDLSIYDQIIVINNAWRVIACWTEHIFPYDFPKEHQPQHYASDQKVIDENLFVPQQNEFGGFVFAGGTMAFTALYWALGAHRPAEIHILGCDMVYPDQGSTHFYGSGTADPLRDDITLRDLYAKSSRFMCMAAAQDCQVFNLSTQPSKLCFPRYVEGSDQARSGPILNRSAVQDILDTEAALGYFVPSGRYWEAAERFDIKALDKVDGLWRRLGQSMAAVSAEHL
jgi:hypothetical protein